jgi:hypothetical protein
MSHDPAAPDFRGRRQKLPPEAFALHSGKEPEVRDLIDEKTWASITSLPDDVSLLTSEQHGQTLRNAYAAWGLWPGLVLDIQSLCGDVSRDPLAVAALNATDEFQASVYAALTGFYRQALGTLRPAVEAMLAAVYFKVLPDEAAFTKWLEGDHTGRFFVKRVRQKLDKREPFCNFGKPGETLMADAGWFAWLYGILSAFLHGRPAHTDETGRRVETTNGGMWEGNGPIYAENAFVLWSRLYFNALLLSVLLAGLADTRLVRHAKPSDVSYEAYVERLLHWHPEPGAPVTAAEIAEYLMPARQN